MDIDKIIESLNGSLDTAALGQYAQTFTAQAAAAQEFEQLAGQIWHRYYLTRIYTAQEVMQACKEVCSHYPWPAMRTMGILAGELNSGIAREFFTELGKLGQKRA